MNKEDYTEEVDRLNNSIMKLELEKDLLVREFKLECQHEGQHLTVNSSYEEDEYGKYMHNWTKHYYTCSNCGVTSGGFYKKLGAVIDIQAAITAEIKKEYKL